MDLREWEPRDPDMLIKELDQRHPFQPGRVVVGLVRLPSMFQRLLASKIIWDDETMPTDHHDLLPILRETAIELFGSRDQNISPPQYTWITVIGRRGRVVFGAHELVWFSGWRYSNHFLPTYVGEYVGVTEHGWRLWGGDLGGATPAARLPPTSDPAATG